MPIRPFLAGQPFKPELIRQMSLAFETVCGKFGMELTDSPATRGHARRTLSKASANLPMFAVIRRA